MEISLGRGMIRLKEDARGSVWSGFYNEIQKLELLVPLLVS